MGKSRNLTEPQFEYLAKQRSLSTVRRGDSVTFSPVDKRGRNHCENLEREGYLTLVRGGIYMFTEKANNLFTEERNAA